MKRTIRIWDREGEVMEIPAVWVICECCEGDGVTVNPSIDGHGISTQDEIWQDEEFREHYRSGWYDVECGQCYGKGRELLPDYDRLSDEQLASAEHHYGEEIALRAMARGEKWC